MNTKIALESLALDLRRVAQCYHRGSIKVAQRFSQEALNRVSEINTSEVKPYIQKLLLNTKSQLSQDNHNDIAESSLLLSTLIQNYAHQIHPNKQ